MVDGRQLGATVFPHLRRQNGAPRLVGDQLGSVTDAQHGYVSKLGEIDIRGAGVAHGARATRQNHAPGLGTDCWNLVKWVDFTVDVQFANPPGNQLSVLGTEVQDENLLWHAQN